jgi:hypothetical protein
MTINRIAYRIRETRTQRRNELTSTEYTMGLFWDLYQQSQISDHTARAGAVEQRVAQLESELMRTQQLLREVIARLERHVGVDLDRDGHVG